MRARHGSLQRPLRLLPRRRRCRPGAAAMLAVIGCVGSSTATRSKPRPVGSRSVANDNSRAQVVLSGLADDVAGRAQLVADLRERVVAARGERPFPLAADGRIEPPFAALLEDARELDASRAPIALPRTSPAAFTTPDPTRSSSGSSARSAARCAGGATWRARWRAAGARPRDRPRRAAPRLLQDPRRRRRDDHRRALGAPRAPSRRRRGGGVTFDPDALGGDPRRLERLRPRDRAQARRARHEPLPRAPRPPRRDGAHRAGVRGASARPASARHAQRRRARRRRARRAARPARGRRWADGARARAAALDRVREPEAGRARAPRRTRRAAARLAAALGIDGGAARAAVEPALRRGRRRAGAAGRCPPRTRRRVLDDEDFARTIHSMGTSLLGWTQACSRAGSSPTTRACSASPARATVAWKGYAAVAAAKVALESVARSIAVELAPYGVRCNVIQAGVTDTPALRAIPGNDAPAGAGAAAKSLRPPHHARGRRQRDLPARRPTRPPGSTAR